MTASAHPVLSFLDFVLDAPNARLSQGTRVLALRPKTFAVLVYLAANPGRLVPKGELLEVVWPATAVTDWVLTSCIRELRDALGDDARQPRVVETVYGRGYRFVAAMGPATAVMSGGAPASPTQPLESELDRLLVGRVPELQMLMQSWPRACAGQRQIVLVIGEPGMGKTALTEAFVRRLPVADAESPPPLIAHGQCVEQHGAGEPYMPVLEALERLCAAPDGAPLVELRVSRPSGCAKPVLLGSDECEALERRLGITSRERMLREMATLVAALPAPLVLILEDLHWSDHATLDVVTTLAQRRDPARLLLIGTYRPVDVATRNHPLRSVHQDLRAHGRCQEMWITPLTEEDVTDYLRARWPQLADAAMLAGPLHDHTDGNPLFLTSMADYLAAEGAILEVDGVWRVQRDPTALATGVPPDLHRLIAAHVDRLDDEDRTALEAGSVVGRRFSAALVAAALDADTVVVEQRLARLARAGLIVCSDGATEWPDGTVAGAYRFNHFLHQSVLRDRLPPAWRRQLHERIAARIEQAFAGHVADVSAELAVHLEASGHAERAVPNLEELAARALRRGAHREAVVLLERALAILDPLPRTPERTLRTIRLCITLGSALLPGGHTDPRLLGVYEQARRLSEESDDPVQLFQVLCALTATYAMQARFDRGRESAQQLARLLETMPMPPFVFAGSLFIAMVEYHSGSLAEARVLLERAVALADVPLPPLGTDLHTLALCYLALTLVHDGCPDRARALIRQALARSSAEIRPFDRSVALNVTCMTQFLLRDLDGLARTADEASALVDFPAALALGRLSRGRVLSARGEHQTAIAAMREGIEAFRAASQRIALPLLIAALAECHAAAGDPAAAFACVAEARSAAEGVGEVRYLAELHRLEGALHAAAGDRAQADRCYRRAIELAREQGARWWELRATTSAAKLALLRGTRAEVRRVRHDALAALVATFEEGGDTPDLQDARRVLGDLA